MKIVSTNWNGEVLTESVEGYVTHALEVVDCEGGGAVEDADRKAENCIKFVARLASCLIDNGVLRPQQLSFAVNGWEDHDFKVVG